MATFIQGKTRPQIRREYPTSVIVKVDGGFMVFASTRDWKTWKAQK